MVEYLSIDFHAIGSPLLWFPSVEDGASVAHAGLAQLAEVRARHAKATRTAHHENRRGYRRLCVE